MGVVGTPWPIYTPGKRLCVCFIGGWLGLRGGVDGNVYFRFHRDSIPGLSSPWRVAVSTELSRPTNLPEEGLIHKFRCAPTIFHWRGEANVEVVYNGCLIVKVMFKHSWNNCNRNVTYLQLDVMYIHI
jgi:hypothetical protein